MSSYDALAASYDGLMADGVYLRRAAYLEQLFRRSAIPVRTVLDLGCGTGTIACLLSQRGYRVTATPLFVLQSMPRLHLPEPVDAAISTLDSLNYLTRERDIRETFHRVFRFLKPGGSFIFDVNTPYKLRRMDCQLYTDETEESYCVWRTFFSEKQKICTYQVDLFRLRPDGAWERDYEEHRERAWSAAELTELLSAAGFERIRITGDLSERAPKDTEDRWIVRCRRPKEGKNSPGPAGA